MYIEWIAYCEKCGEIDKAPNGELMEAAAKRHKRQFLTHKVIIGAYITAEDAVLSKI